MTNVVWLSYHENILARGYWDQGLLEEILPKDSEHFTDTRDVGGDGAIVVINGRTHTGDISRLNEDIGMLKWVIFIETGDEEAIFPWRDVRHPMMKVWLQLPRPGEHDDITQKLPNGYRPTTRKMLRETPRRARMRDWAFIGQINHQRREQCVAAAKDIPNGFMVTTDAFGKEDISYPDYIEVLAETKIALCPSGIETPDSFRLYEALEAGCLPIVDAFSTNNPQPGFWRYLFGDDIPFPIISDWSLLPEMLPRLLNDWPRNANRAFSWWLQRKRKLKWTLVEQVKEFTNG